ncbi:MAG: GPW/gp25 family protein [Nitrospira sp.]
MSETVEAGDETLGRGIAFPLRFEGGKLGMNAHESQVEQSIRLILRTGQGERVMRPDFGAGIDRLAFEPLGAVTVALIQHQVKETLTRFEPRIEVLGITAEAKPDEGRLDVIIQYRVKRTDSVNNLVYPFYLERGEIR